MTDSAAKLKIKIFKKRRNKHRKKLIDEEEYKMGHLIYLSYWFWCCKIVKIVL